MRHFHLTRNQYWKPIINVDKLWSLVPPAEKESKGDLAPVIDILKHGYAKVLGNGVLPERPVIVKARYVSELAESVSTCIHSPMGR